MKKEDNDNIKSQMRKGILELCVLRILEGGEAYPSDIIKTLNDARLLVVEGTIYTLLNRLRREGKLDYRWQESRQGPPRKYFFLTGTGLDTLKSLNNAWEDIQLTVNYCGTQKYRKNEKDI